MAPSNHSSTSISAKAAAVLVLLLGLSLVSGTGARAADRYLVNNTIPAWDGSSYIYPFGNPGTQTYGQTITVPRYKPVLRSVDFVIKVDPAVRFRGYLYAWDAAAMRATGPRLWSSGVRQTSVYDFERVRLGIGQKLRPGTQYVVFLSTAGLSQPPGTRQEGQFAQPQNQDLYGGGAFVFFNNATPAQWTSETWDGGDGAFLGPGGDLAFRSVHVE
jgi:hypothetical protein